MPEIDLGPIIGPQGPQGATGPAGAVGPGVPAGGTAGQIVTKKSSTGFDTEWRSPVNDANQTEAGYVLDARMGKTLNDKVNNNAFPIQGGSTISTATDFNTLITPGIYTIPQDATVRESDNCPSILGGRLCVYTHSGNPFTSPWQYGNQIYLDRIGAIYIRPISTNDSGTINFGAWDRIVLNSEIANKVKTESQISGSYKNTGTDWENTGLTVTVPVGRRYFVYASTEWTSGKPIGLGFDTSPSLYSLYDAPAYTHENGGNVVFITSVFMLTQGTYYLYTKRASAANSANNYAIQIVSILI